MPPDPVRLHAVNARKPSRMRQQQQTLKLSRLSAGRKPLTPCACKRSHANRTETLNIFKHTSLRMTAMREPLLANAEVLSSIWPGAQSKVIEPQLMQATFPASPELQTQITPKPRGNVTIKKYGRATCMRPAFPACIRGARCPARARDSDSNATLVGREFQQHGRCLASEEYLSPPTGDLSTAYTAHPHAQWGVTHPPQGALGS